MEKSGIEQLIESLPGAAFLLEPDGSIINMNRQARALLGLSGQSKQEPSFESYVVWGDRPALRELFLNSIESGDDSEGVMIRLKAADREIPVAVSAQSFHQDKRQGYILLARNISRQIELERQRKIQYELVRSLLGVQHINEASSNLLHAGLEISGFDHGAFFILEPERGEWRCLSAEGEKKRELFQLPIPDYMDGKVETLTRMMQFSRRRNADTLPVPHVFSQIGMQEVVIIPLLLKQSVAALLILFSSTETFLDPEMVKSLEIITSHFGSLLGRITSEKRFRKSEEFNRLLLKSMPSGLLVRDLDGVIIHFNEAAEALLGVDAIEVIGKEQLPGTVRIYDEGGRRLSHPELPTIRILDTGKQLRNLHVRVERPDGSEVWLSVSGEPLKQYGLGPGGRSSRPLEAAVVTMKDITDHKKMLNELERARQAAESANSSKSQFLANMSHEIRTPLSGIMGMTDILLSGPASEDQKENLLLMKEAEESLLEIINKVLEISKIEAGKVVLEKEPFRLRGAITKASLPLFMSCKEKGIVLDIEISQDIPEQLIGDGHRLIQVLTNLLSNALKFTDHGSITLRVRRSFLSETGKIELSFSVNDTGIGIDGEEQSHIFEDFRQVDTGKGKKHQGTGLGLAISKKLVELMGGEIGVESSPGKGSSFYFTARFHLTSQEEEAKPRLSPPVEEGGHLRILLAEDNALNQRSIRHFLESEGHSVVIVDNGKMAIEALEKEPFDVVLMDVQMPTMDGLEATRVIRSHDRSRYNPDIPIIALTAYALKEDEMRFITSGMDRYVTKPVRKELLFQALREMTGNNANVLETGAELSHPQEDLYEFLRDYQNDLDIAGQILDLYIEEYPEKRDQLQQAINRREKGQLTEILHSITNNLSALRVFSTGNECHLVEVLANEGDLEEVERRMGDILPRLEEIHKNAIRCRELIQTLE